MATNIVRLKACGGLAPYTWAVTQGPATVFPPTGTATTVTCTPGTVDNTAVKVSCTDAAGVMVTYTFSGHCACTSDCDPEAPGNLPTTSWCTTGPGSVDSEAVCVPSGATTGGTAGCALICCPAPFGSIVGESNDPPACATPYLKMTYMGVMEGTPATGLLMRTRSSTDSNTTGIGFLIDESDSSLKCYTFVNESIVTGGTLVASGTSEGAGAYEFWPWIFSWDGWWGGAGNSPVWIGGPGAGTYIVDIEIDSLWSTFADCVTGMGSGGGLMACVWGKKSGTDSKASWSSMVGECGHCYDTTGTTTDPTCTLTLDECGY